MKYVRIIFFRFSLDHETEEPLIGMPLVAQVPLIRLWVWAGLTEHHRTSLHVQGNVNCQS